ncbi:hypothetical protein V6B33_11285 [Mangrovibacillus sp. Mu-81]|uniref:hypothetical protein n=1 Tax=Mangrovibacillus sp. Mu-81 TaxID=3121478 RepID=UPI002FE4B869
MKAVDVFCLCENRKYTERFQGLLINDQLIAVVGDMGLTVSKYETEENRIIVDYEVHDILLEVHYPRLEKTDNFEAVKLANMTVPEFIHYLLAWDGGEVNVDIQPGDYIYQPSGGYIRKASYVYPNGTVTTDTGELMARSDYQILNEEETQLVNKLSKSLRDNRSITEGYEVGKLSVEDEGVQIGNFILQTYDTIEVFVGEEIKQISFDEAIDYDGYDARFRPIKLTVLTEGDFKR